MASEMFPRVQLDAMEDALKLQFAEGMLNKKLAQQVKLIFDRERKHKQFNIADTINFTRDLHRAYETKMDNKQDEKTMINDNCSNVCTITNHIQEIKGKYDNSNDNNQVKLNRCAFDEANTRTNVEIIVTEDQETMNKCIIGTDLMLRIPEFKNLIDMVEEKINIMSKGILKRYDQQKNQQIIEKKVENKKDFKQIFNMEIISEEKDTDDQDEAVRKNLETKFTECSATSLDDIIPKS